ncbi:choice-of-anchor B family protein [Rhodothermus profundi]|uniref:Choice-of-anchor B domain-containing protein n=1 Tax=Rhodothermus profundi TaxID=633813 RepID=A0A1M6TXR0_9BACT|nr:choice-of-anchor B family protein [Rhodothermus profundi]SHK61680.1 choice-of-anchor B domain-containing protein [Rhodothermus profundi]
MRARQVIWLLWLLPGVALAQPAQRTLLPVTGQAVQCLNGQAAGFSCNQVTLLSFLPLASIDDDFSQDDTTVVRANDIWGWVDPETDRRYALVGLSNGVSVVDVTDPVQPRLVAFLPEPERGHAHKARPARAAHEGASLWRDIKTYGPYALVVSDNNPGHGLQIFDLRKLKSISQIPVVLEPVAHYHGFGKAHNIVVNEETGFAYAVGVREHPDSLARCDFGYHAIDLANPLRPRFAGCFKSSLGGYVGPGYTHDAQCVIYRGPDPDYQGREICIGTDETGIAILDVTDKTNVQEIAAFSYPDVGYAHQGWLDETHRYFYAGDELDEVRAWRAYQEDPRSTPPRTRMLIFDLADLDSPRLAAEYWGPTAAIDHNLFVRDRLLFQANYTAGLRVLDISDREQPVEIGFFDTYRWSDAVRFAGAWGVYPFLPDGVVLVSSIGEGLFVLRLESVPTARQLPGKAPRTGFSAPAPHPWRSTTQLRLYVDRPQWVQVQLLDLLGRTVQTVLQGYVGAGSVLLTLRGEVAPGLYLLRAEGETFTAVQPLVRMR